MRKIISVFLLLFLTASLVSAQGISFLDGTWSQTLKQAKKENKLIFVDCYSTWCGPCRNMEVNIFPQKEIGDFYNENFICVKYNMEVDFGRVLSERYNVVNYPTFLFINPNGFVVKIGAGFLSAEKFLALGKEAFELKDSLTQEERFSVGERNDAFLKEYLGEMVDAWTPQVNRVNSILEVLFAERNGELFNDKFYWDAYVKCAYDINASISLYVVQNRKALGKIYGDSAVNEKIRELYTNFKRVLSLCSGKNPKLKRDEIQLNEYARLIHARKLDDAQGLVQEVYFSTYARIDQDPMKAVRYGEKVLKKASTEKLYRWSEKANQLLKTRESRDVAVIWAERALKGLTDQEMIRHCKFLREDLKNNISETRSKGGQKKK